MTPLGLERKGAGIQQCSPGDWVWLRLDCGDEFCGFVHERVEHKLVLLRRQIDDALSSLPPEDIDRPGTDGVDDLVIVPDGEIEQMAVWRAYRWVAPWELGGRRPPARSLRSTTAGGTDA